MTSDAHIPTTWGDTDYDAVDAVDALQILRWIAALPTNQQPNCPEVARPSSSTSRAVGETGESRHGE